MAHLHAFPWTRCRVQSRSKGNPWANGSGNSSGGAIGICVLQDAKEGLLKAARTSAQQRAMRISSQLAQVWAPGVLRPSVRGGGVRASICEQSRSANRAALVASEVLPHGHIFVVTSSNPRAPDVCGGSCNRSINKASRFILGFIDSLQKTVSVM